MKPSRELSACPVTREDRDFILMHSVIATRSFYSFKTSLLQVAPKCDIRPHASRLSTERNQQKQR